MTAENPQPTTESTVSQLGGGRSARVAALAVVVVLGVVVWIGISGKPPAPLAPVAPVAPAATSLTADAPRSATSSHVAQSAPPEVAAEPPNDSFGVTLFTDAIGYNVVLQEKEPGHLTGEVRVSESVTGDSEGGHLVFQQLTSRSAPPLPVQIGQWSVSLLSLEKISGRIDLILDEQVAPKPIPANAPRPIVNGYWIRAGTRTSGAAGTVVVDVRIGPNPELVARNDDPFAGADEGPRADVPVSVPREKPATFAYVRDRGLYNRCRWDISPYSGQPIPGTDEASC